MRNRGRRRGAGRRLSSVGGKALGRFDILTITNGVGPDDGFMYVTTAAPHGLTGSETVVISGSSVAFYNGTHLVVAAISATVFRTDTGYASDATGGTWALA
jgi:hypothetical protein